jgi:hypothetical protein
MMPDDVDLMQLASTGQKLARLDDTDYLAVHVVLAWAADGTPTVYCAYHDWASMPIARLAAKEQEIAELAAGLERYATEATDQARRAEVAEARIKELEAQLAERAEQPPPETPMQNQTKMLEKQAASLSVEDTTPAAVIQCPDCGKGGWKNTHALDVHRGRAHAPQQFVEELGWHCAAKGCSGAHARDLHDPAFCTLHATPRTNGVLS